MNCPKCIGKLGKIKLSTSTVHYMEELAGASVSQNLEVDQCFVCGGVWFDKGELAKYNIEVITAVDSPSIGGDLDVQLDKKVGECPRCQIEMKKKIYGKDNSITLDECGKCGGIWLDSTEIDRVEKANKPKLGYLDSLIKALKKKSRK